MPGLSCFASRDRFQGNKKKKVAKLFTQFYYLNGIQLFASPSSYKIVDLLSQ